VCKCIQLWCIFRNLLCRCYKTNFIMNNAITVGTLHRLCTQQPISC
jgi:hypothetical protein